MFMLQKCQGGEHSGTCGGPLGLCAFSGLCCPEPWSQCVKLLSEAGVMFYWDTQLFLWDEFNWDFLCTDVLIK